MKQSIAQVPALQTSPVAQIAPLATLLQSVVVVPGWQLWQGLLEFVVPDV
jgi:hypothetical protein